MTPIHFALNHMAAPTLPLEDFLALADRLGCRGVELRNDLPGNAIADGREAAAVRRAAATSGLRILSVNALYPFNRWERAGESAERLAHYAGECGAEALVLVPLNDGTGQNEGERGERLREALENLAPILRGAGLAGLVEPLGFPISSLRHKREALDGIDAIGGGDVFRLVHDTFHHHLAGERDLFPRRTGLVHVSGVTDRSLAVSQMLDDHRLLVDGADRLGNVEQIRALLDGGYEGFFSFEPFAPSVHASQDLEGDLAASIRHVESRL